MNKVFIGLLVGLCLMGWVGSVYAESSLVPPLGEPSFTKPLTSEELDKLRVKNDNNLAEMKKQEEKNLEELKKLLKELNEFDKPIEEE